MNARNRRRFHECMGEARQMLRRMRKRQAERGYLKDYEMIYFLHGAAYMRHRARYYLGVKNP